MEQDLDRLLERPHINLHAAIHTERAALVEARTALRDDENALANLQQMTGELLHEVQQLRVGATESEVVVRGITKDIRALDNAKRNLVASMTAIKRLQMLGASGSRQALTAQSTASSS